MENSRNSLEEDISELKKHKQLSVRLSTKREGRGDAQQSKETKALAPCDLRARTLAREGFFNRAETQRIPVSYGTDTVILECRHSTTRMASDVEAASDCLSCIEEWMNNQMQHPEEGVA